MEDEPYRERIGGSYVVDPKTGETVAVEGPAAKAAEPAPVEPQAAEEPAESKKKGK